MKTQLVIMAAGIGSRFGQGIKQLEKIGKNGEVIMEYSIDAAKKAGFDEVVIIIRKEIEKDFKEVIGNRIENKIQVRYAYQELDMLPDGYKAPMDRKKPYGTGHTIICAKSQIDSPFLVINADDYYGEEGFKKVHEYLINANQNSFDMCMAGFIISNTLSKNGTVTRGVCKEDENHNLLKVTETYEIKKDENGKIIGEDENGEKIEISETSLVSMNMWGLPVSFIKELENRFVDFLKKNNNNIKSEYLLPQIIDNVINENNGTVKVLPVKDRWYGITYASDVEEVKKALKNINL